MATKLKISLYLLVSLIGFGLVYLYFNFSPSDYGFFPKCVFHSLTGLYCPGCGSQRAMHALLHGHILEGLKHNVLIVLVASVLLYDLSIIILKHVLSKEFKNILHQTVTTQIILVLVILFWVFRNIKIYPFTILAP